MKTVNKWSPEELQFLKDNYYELGPRGCSEKLGRKPSVIATRANHLGLKTQVVKGTPKREVYQKHEDYWVCECPTHGKQKHYYKSRSGPRCVVCEKEYTTSDVGQKKRAQTREKRRSTLVGRYEDRIRVSLNCYVRGKISYSKHLGYSASDLVRHISSIHMNRNNRCDMCHKSFEVEDMDIDHITPLSTAKTFADMKRLFRLENLQPLCPRCNRNVKRAKVGVQ